MEQSLFDLRTIFEGIIIGDDCMVAAEETNGKVTLAVLVAEVRSLTKLLETYHNDECDWREKMDERVRRLEAESAARMMRWQDHEREHQMIQAISKKTTPTDPMLLASVKTKDGDTTVPVLLTWRYVLLIALLGAAGGSAIMDVIVKLILK